MREVRRGRLAGPDLFFGRIAAAISPLPCITLRAVRLFSFLCHGLIAVVLTLLTQIGGVAYVMALLATKLWRRAGSPRWRRTVYLTVATLLVYTIASWAMPLLAANFDRVPVRCGATTKVACLLNRAYLRSTTITVVNKLDRDMASRFRHSHVTVLEGSFPLFDGFPLPPHLSHHDGRKVDLAYFYRDARGQPIPRGSPSPLGYFHFQQPRPGDHEPCAGRFTPLRWDFAWLQPKEPAWVLDEERTRAMILWLKARPEVTRIFIEPHLADRLGVGGGKVRFQGCQAARHDDHLHVEVQ